MASSGVEMNVRSFSPVIDACCKACKLQRAQELFAEMRELRISPNIVIFTSMARPYAQRGDWRQVESLKRELEEEGLRVSNYFLCVLLTSYAKASPRESARAEREFRCAVGREKATALTADWHTTRGNGIAGRW